MNCRTCLYFIKCWLSRPSHGFMLVYSLFVHYEYENENFLFLIPEPFTSNSVNSKTVHTGGLTLFPNLTKHGDIIVAGISIVYADDYKSWKNITSIACGFHHIIAYSIKTRRNCRQ